MIMMIKRITIEFGVEITDELLSEGISSDDKVIEGLKEAYNDFIRTEGCSDATIKIKTIYQL